MTEDRWYRDRIRGIVCSYPYLVHREFRRIVLQNYDKIMDRLKNRSICIDTNKNDYQLCLYRPEDLEEALRWLLI